MVALDALLGGDGAHADMVEPCPSDATGGVASAPVPTGGPCLDLVVCIPGPSLPGSTASGDMV
jgi:hypothetical protein